MQATTKVARWRGTFVLLLRSMLLPAAVADVGFIGSAVIARGGLFAYHDGIGSIDDLTPRSTGPTLSTLAAQRWQWATFKTVAVHILCSLASEARERRASDAPDPIRHVAVWLAMPKCELGRRAKGVFQTVLP